ncbi:MAG: FAD-binding protein [Acidianus sp.]|uniref:FAD-binding protein n=1 Tax=Acidianus sp. TaxID=1872104 RepID=UPI00397A4117
MIKLLLDSSIFSRAIITFDISSLKKFMTVDEKEVVVGNLTSMSGEILSYLNPKPIKAAIKLPDGSYYKIIGKKYGMTYAEVPAGLTFEELIEKLKSENLFPAIFPLYLKGTIGGFISTNGSGFGSYKYGFVKYKIPVYELKDKDTAIVGLVNYSELIELDQESPFAWSAVIFPTENIVKYYVPSFYSSLVGKGKVVSLEKLINDIYNSVQSILKRDYIPVCLRASEYSVLIQSPIESKLGYIINYNSPSKFYVICGNIKRDNLDKLFDFLKKNPSVYPFPSLQEYKEIHKFILSKYKKEIKIPKNLEKIKSQYLDAVQCINCGLCLDKCLAYTVTKNIIYSPVGKINRLLTGVMDFEYCFGCKNDDDYCPVGIKISELTEVLPQLNKYKDKISIPIDTVPSRLKELEALLDSKYKSYPVYLLFVGCAAKYDPLGIEGFMNFLLEKGEELKGFSPRVKLLDNECCGFDKYITGDIDGAKNDVSKIVDIKNKLAAQKVYFLCPEGLYVYNSLSGDKGILAYEVIKPYVKDKVYLGCWAKKLGFEGEEHECAGLLFTSYKGAQLPLFKKNIITICPFSTWKFSSQSVYSLFNKGEKLKAKDKVIFEFSDQLFTDYVISSLKNSVLASVDDIADKTINWIMGGKNYFILLIIPIIRKRFSSLLISSLSENKELVNSLKTLSENKLLMEDKIRKVIDIINSYNFTELVSDLIVRISNSPRLEYEAKKIIESEDYKKALEEAIKKVIIDRVLEDTIQEVIYS